MRLPVKLPGKSLKTQLTTLIFALTAVAVSVLSFLGVRAVFESGIRAEAITSSSMQKRVQQLLVQTTDAAASRNSVVFSNIQGKVRSTAEYMQDIFARPSDFSSSSWAFDKHIFRLAGGQYTNSATELGSVYVPINFPFTALNKRRLELSGYLDYLAPQMLSSEPDAVAVYYMGATAGETRYYPNIDLASIVDASFSVTDQEFFSVATPQNDPDKSTKWTNVYDDPAGHGLTITASSPMYNNGAFSGIMSMDVSLDHIAKNIEGYSPIESSYAFLIDSAGRAIALPAQGYRDLLGRAPKAGEFGSDLSGVKGDFGDILKNMRAGKQGFASAQSNKTGLYVSYAPVAGTPFSVGIVARQAAMLKVVTDLRAQVGASTRQVLYFQFIPVGAALLGLVWLFGFVYIRRVTGPIKELTARTAEVASGNFTVKPEVVGSDNEIGQLATSFNRMVDELRGSRRRIEEQNQELLHNEQARLKASINSLHVGFIMTDTNNNIILINGAAQKMLSKSPGKSWETDGIDERLGPEVAFKSALARVLRTGKPVDKKEVVFGDLVLRIFIAPILEDGPGSSAQKLGAVVLIENITEAKLLERSRDEFFSIASHELRTPLTAVRGNASLLQQVYAPQLHDKDFDEIAGDIHDASVRLIEIVNDFLDTTRLEQGKLKFDNVNFSVAEILGAVVHEMGGVASGKGVELKADSDTAALPMVFADKNRVKQVTYNLVGNALKFTTEGTIWIDARVDGQKLKVFVHDTGPGISDENQRLLFRKFQQASNSFLTRDTRGSGLGLYISKLLVEQMGGHIALEESTLGVGTTFSFTLPLAKKG